MTARAPENRASIDPDVVAAVSAMDADEFARRPGLAAFVRPTVRGEGPVDHMLHIVRVVRLGAKARVREFQRGSAPGSWREQVECEVARRIALAAAAPRGDAS